MPPARGTGRRPAQPPYKSSRSKPGAQKKGTSKRRRAPESDDEDGDDVQYKSVEFYRICKKFFRKSCKIHVVTKLFNVPEDYSRHEKKIAYQLMEKCKYQQQKGAWRYTVKIQEFSHVKMSEYDGRTLYMYVYRTDSDADEDEDDSGRNILECLITSRGYCPISRHFGVHTPLLLVSGPDTVFKVVKPMLEEVYHCFVHPLKDISSDKIKLIFGRFYLFSLRNDVNSKSSAVSLEFTKMLNGALVKLEGNISSSFFDEAADNCDANNEGAKRLWFKLFDSIEFPIPVSVHTSISKIKHRTIRTAQNGVVRAKIESEEMLLDFLTVLTYIAQKASDPSLRHNITEATTNPNG